MMEVSGEGGGAPSGLVRLCACNAGIIERCVCSVLVCLDTRINKHSHLRPFPFIHL